MQLNCDSHGIVTSSQAKLLLLQLLSAEQTGYNAERCYAIQAFPNIAGCLLADVLFIIAFPFCHLLLLLFPTLGKHNGSSVGPTKDATYRNFVAIP